MSASPDDLQSAAAALRWKPRRIVATNHAADRYRQRLRAEGTYSGRSVKALIEEEVRLSMVAGLVFNEKTRPFMLYRETKRKLPSGQVFVVSRDRQAGWFVQRERDVDVVLSTLLRVR